MLEGPLGMKLMIRNMAIREGQNLDELDPFSLEKDDPVKADIEELMFAMGITAQDLKDGIVRGPEDDDDDEWYRINKSIPPEDDFTDWPKLAQEEDPWRKYRDANGQVVPPIFNNSKKLHDDDDVPAPPAAGGDDKQMDDDEIKKMKNDDDVLLCFPSVITYGRRGCKRTNDDEIKRKNKKKKDDGAAAADKQAEG